MFRKLLIANRGEIAVRIMKTCKRLGIQTVAIYSEADASALHVKLADEAYCVGGARVHESYLQIERILELARETGAEAIHPGYGLLSENATFAARCQEEGTIFVGPSPKVIETMGSKVQSRQAMIAAGIPVVPGIVTALAAIEEAHEAARTVGYPCMLKASAGGGGIGMQIVDSEAMLQQVFERNQARAMSFFGNGEMYIEKVITPVHHIEVQLLADSHGNVLHVWERECSVQRRNQKVIEEAPSPFLREETRRSLGETAVLAAKAIGYENAGTMEFLVDENEQFYFLEMNTRLQVEHPVTEEISGLDLVEQQLRIAYGEPLAFCQAEVKQNGYAIEARVYAEDPKTFFPSPGTIQLLELPGDVRVDHFLESGMKITPFYDPLLAKVVANGNTRIEAIQRLEGALQKMKIEGIKTNIPMLLRVLQHQQFQNGTYTTDFVAKYLS